MQKNDDYKKNIYAKLFPEKIGKGDRTKLRIIEACIDCIAEEGISSVTFSSVGDRARLKAPQIKYHFNDKEDLIFSAIEYVMFTPQEFFVKRIKGELNWEAQVYAMVAGLFDWADAHPEQGPVYLQFFQLSTFHPKYREIHTKMYQTGEKRIQSILRQAAQERKWKQDHIEWLGATIWATADGYMLYRLGVEGYKKDYFRKLAEKTISFLLEKS